MPLASQTTAEHVMATVEAIVVNGGPATVDVVAAFLDTTVPNTTAALDMAIELGLLSNAGGNYAASGPLCRFTAIPEQKAAVLRIVIENYRPFTVFRDRLLVTADLRTAAQATKVLC